MIELNNRSKTLPTKPASIDLSKLLGYYLACVEEEDRRSLELSADPKYGQFISSSGEPGALFRGEAEIEWAPSADDRKFIDKYSFDLKKQRFIYGYPTLFDDSGHVAPLFLSEVEMVRGKNGPKVKIRLSHPGAIQVNLQLFRSTHSMALERIELQDYLEGPDFGTIDARIGAALARLGIPGTNIASVATPTGAAGWKNQAILFRDSGAMFTAQLRRELSDLKSRHQSISNSALGALLGMPRTSQERRIRLLEVIALNKSQRAAVESALTNPITVITGPPGTGKSQVVVAMLASLGAAGAPVLFASKNNQAVDVVRDRLNTVLGDADWFLRLGSKITIEEECSQKIKAAEMLAAAGTQLPREPIDNLPALIDSRNQIDDSIRERAELVLRYLALTDKQRASLSEASEPWINWSLSNGTNEWLPEDIAIQISRNTPDVIALSDGHWPGIWLWIKHLVIGHKLMQGYADTLHVMKQPSNPMPSWRSSSELSWNSLKADYRDLNTAITYHKIGREIRSAKNTLSSGESTADIEAKRKAISDSLQSASQVFAQHSILQRVRRESRRLPTMLKEYWELTQKAARLSQKASSDVQAAFARAAKVLLDVIPGVVVTSLSARRSIPMSADLFECVIIDEASQCDIASAIPLLLRAKRLVVIGDPKQLRHISSLSEHTDQKLAAEQQATSLLAKYSYRTKSLYDCAAEALESLGGQPFFLQDHYRSHPDIVDFSNRLFYQRRLVLRSPAQPALEQALFWHDIPSTIADGHGSLINPTEAQAVHDLALKVITSPSFKSNSTLGIVTPFRRQRDRIEQLFQGDTAFSGLGERLTIGTVHTFQGAEADVIIFSPVVSDGARPRAAEWISKEEGLLNVALTRARRALHIVGNKSFCSATPGPLGELAKFVNQRVGVAQGPKHDSPAVQAVRSALQEIGIWYQEEVPETTPSRTYYLDFVIIGLSGTRYNIEVDGRQHYFSAEAISEDKTRDQVLREAGYEVIRLRASDVISDSGFVSELLRSLA